MESGTQIVHNQLGKGTVVFDKEHCIQVDFILHGKWNFAQEEWASGRVAPERLRGINSLAGPAASDLEYELGQAVENGDISEAEALRMFEQKVHPLEVRNRRTPDINRMHSLLLTHPKDKGIEDDFYKTLLGYVTTIVKSRSKDGSTFSNIEDAISKSILRVWQSLDRYDAKRSSFARFVTIIVTGEIGNLYRAYQSNQVAIDEADTLIAGGLSVEQKALFQEWVGTLEPEDRTLVQMFKDGLTQVEIAEALGISQPAISQRLSRLQEKYKKPL